MRRIDIGQHWPEFLRAYQELQELAKVENLTLNEAMGHIRDLYSAAFIKEAGSEYLTLYEEWWRLGENSGLPIEERRLALIAEINKHLPYTKRFLKQLLEELLGQNNFLMEVIYAERHLHISLELKAHGRVDFLYGLLRDILPANMTFSFDVHLREEVVLRNGTREFMQPLYVTGSGRHKTGTLYRHQYVGPKTSKSVRLTNRTTAPQQRTPKTAEPKAGQVYNHQKG